MFFLGALSQLSTLIETDGETEHMLGLEELLHTDKSFRNIIKSIRNQIIFTIFQLIWNQTVVRLVPNQSKNGKYNRISV